MGFFSAREILRPAFYLLVKIESWTQALLRDNQEPVNEVAVLNLTQISCYYLPGPEIHMRKIDKS